MFEACRVDLQVFERLFGTLPEGFSLLVGFGQVQIGDQVLQLLERERAAVLVVVPDDFLLVAGVVFLVHAENASF